MTIARIQSFAFAGIDANPIDVQVQISPGLPVFMIVGLADKAVGESRERVRAALTAMGLGLPPKRILVNLAPADLVKEGSHFDLPIALGVLAAMDVLPIEEVANFAALGELSLDGRLAPVAGVLPAAIAAAGRDLGLIGPAVQGAEAAWAGEIGVLAAPDLLSLVNHFKGESVLPNPPKGKLNRGTDGLDLADVKGMEFARRAGEIAASGGHNILLCRSWRPMLPVGPRCRVGAVHLRRCRPIPTYPWKAYVPPQRPRPRRLGRGPGVASGYTVTPTATRRNSRGRPS